MRLVAFACIALGTMSFAQAAPEGAEKPAVGSNPKVKYRKGKDLNFDELLIQGQNKRPEATVVTGNVKQGGDGLLRLREDFVDRVVADYGEEQE
jgi:hypothetical protein